MPQNGMMQQNGMMPQNGMVQQASYGTAGPTPNGMTGPPSAIEWKFQQLDNPYEMPEYPTTGNLGQFGYNFFATQVSTFAPVGNVPVGDEYVVGPGDEIDILL